MGLVLCVVGLGLTGYIITIICIRSVLCRLTVCVVGNSIYWVGFLEKSRGDGSTNVHTHTHTHTKFPFSEVATFFNFAKASVGSGSFALPWGILQCGVLLGSAGMIVLGIVR